MGKYKKNLFAMTAFLIPYYKEFRTITGSVISAILWQQLEYRFSVNEGKSFYKYLEPLDKERNGYKIGDSWTEELGFSIYEFRAAFSAIGITYNSKKAFDAESDPFKGKMYCSYIDKMAHQTFYVRNQKEVEANLGRLIKPISIDGKCPSIEVGKTNPDYTETTTETTTEKKEEEKEKQKIEKTEKKNSEKILSTPAQKEPASISELKLSVSRLANCFRDIVNPEVEANDPKLHSYIEQTFQKFKELYSNKAEHNLEKAMENVMQSKYWVKQFKNNPERLSPKLFFNKKWVKSKLVDFVVCSKAKEDDFANDPDVKLVHQHSQEALNKIL